MIHKRIPVLNRRCGRPAKVFTGSAGTFHLDQSRSLTGGKAFGQNGFQAFLRICAADKRITGRGRDTGYIHGTAADGHPPDRFMGTVIDNNMDQIRRKTPRDDRQRTEMHEAGSVSVQAPYAAVLLF